MSSRQDEILLADRDLCFIDVETTGPQFGYHEVIELGAVRVSPDAETLKGEMDFKLFPLHPKRITEQARIINGFSEDAWVGVAQNGADSWKRFAEFASGCVPVCHNPSFDRVFVTLGAKESSVTELGVDYHWVGTESLAWPLVRNGQIRKLSLENLCVLLGVPPEPKPHRALEGARACWAVYRRLVKIVEVDKNRKLFVA